MSSGTAISNSLKVYVAVILMSGALVLATALRHWESASPTRFVCYFALALVASALKVRLPGLTGTYSAGFLFLLIGIAEFHLSELVVISSGIALVQCLWKAESKPNLMQVVFNVANLGISTAIAYEVYYSSLAHGAGEGSFLLLAVTSLVFFLINTLLVSEVLSLVENKSLKEIWLHWYLWSFPYYLVGAAIASVIIESDRYFDWRYSLFMMPFMYGAYAYYRVFVRGRKESRID